jgi:hypothetical protein
MRRLPLLLLLNAVFLPVLLTASFLPAETPRTLRLDYYHTGGLTPESFSLDRVVLEPLPWPGNPAQPFDTTNLGNYFFEVRDKASGKLLYSRGFSSIYGEWVTTEEAKTASRSFSESLRFPAPEKPVEIAIFERDANNRFVPAWRTVVDPSASTVDRATPPSAGALIPLMKNGDSAYKVDFLILGDGYTAAERGKCEADARRLSAILFKTPPFAQHEKDFNVWLLCPASAESGISRPSIGVYRRSAVGASYDSFGSERYVLTTENRTLRDLASQAPYEFLEIVTNSQTYGGGGIYNLYSTVAAGNLFAPYVFVHEFGHHFAGLADEYYTSDIAYETEARKVEPWEPNVTALLDPSVLKWKDLVEASTPLPTPWAKAEYEAYSQEVQAKRHAIRQKNLPEAEMEKLFAEEKKTETKLLHSGPYAGKVGAFEGANYLAKGYYRPQTDCIMFTRSENFCRVCQRAIERIVALYTAQ